MTLEDDLRSIQTRISQAQSKKARAMIERDHAEAKRKEVLATLRNDFGVAKNEDLARIQVELEAAVTEAISAVEAQLTEAGA